MSHEFTKRASVRLSLDRSPIIGVVRTQWRQEAREQALNFWKGGLELVEITFSVPEAVDLVRELLEMRGSSGPWIGMGTVTTAERARAALSAGAEFIVTPNVTAEVAEIAKAFDTFLVMGALTPTEIVNASRLGADIVKIYPLPPVGGSDYLKTIRGPLGDLLMLAAGGFGVEDIPAYRTAGASAFGIGAPLIGEDDASTAKRIARALTLARAEPD